MATIAGTQRRIHALRRGTATVAALLLVAGVAVGAVPAGASPVPPAHQPAAYEDGTVLVTFRPGVTPRAQRAAAADAGAGETRVIGAGTHVLRVGSGRVKAEIARLRRHAEVASAEPNYYLHADTTPNDPKFSGQWALRNTGQIVQSSAGTPGADVKAEPAWTFTQSGDSSVVVGVVDSGIDYKHPDLAANVWSNPGGVGGCPAGTHGYNAVAGTCDPMDDHFHGTHVSGTIGAVGNNGVGVVGVDWNVKIMGLKFLNSDALGTTAGAISAIEFAVQAKIAGVNVRALNNSWGGGDFSQALLDEINKAKANDILFVTSAGNSGWNNDQSPHYPSNYAASNLIAVAATSNTDALALFSNYGATQVHLGAPGVDILSTWPGGQYQYLSGTSMAAPHVVGAAALIVAARPALTVTQLKAAILDNVDPDRALAGLTVTGGRLNVCKAIPGCGGPPPRSFSLSVAPSQSIAQGASATYPVSVTRTGGLVELVTFKVSGLPAGASAQFNPASTTADSSTLTVTTSSTTPSGNFALTVTATGGTLTRTAGSALVVITLITANGPAVTTTLSASSSHPNLAFAGRAGQVVTVTSSGGTFQSSCDVNVDLLDQAGVAIGRSWCAGHSGFIGETRLATTGTYTLDVVPQGANTGSITVSLAANAANTAITANGPSVTFTSTNGQGRDYNFAGTAGQVITVNASRWTFPGSCNVHLDILDPAGVTVATLGCPGRWGFVGETRLAATGIYTLDVVPDDSSSGSLTLSLAANAADAIITANGPSVTFTSTNGQGRDYLFAGSAGQTVTVNASDSTFPGFCDVGVKIVDPAGATIATMGCGSNFIGETRLPTRGTYILDVVPKNANSGTVTFSLSPVAALTASPSTVHAGDQVSFTWSGVLNPTTADWVGLYSSSAAPDSAYLAWTYTGGETRGTAKLTVPSGIPAGTTYELRLFPNNTYSRLARSNSFTVVSYRSLRPQPQGR